MNSNIVKIGKALKWRGVYDNSKKYYAENIVTCYGGVFRCNVSVAQGIPPYELDEDGLPYLYNSETWTCLVDTSWIIEWVLAFKNFKKETVARFEDDERHIEEHCRKLDEHEQRIATLETSSEEHGQKLAEHQEYLESLDFAVGKLQEKDIEHELTMDNLTHSLGQVNQKISDSEFTMGELHNQIIQTNQRIDEEIGGLVEIIEDQKKKIDRLEDENEQLRKQILALQEQLESMGKYNCCFSEGVWYDDLYWHNEGLWNNGYVDPLQPEINIVDYDEETGELEVSGSVISYDEKTGTLSIIDETNIYDSATGTLYIDILSDSVQYEMSATGYEEETGKLGVDGSVINYDENTGTLSIIDETNYYDKATGTLHIDNILGQ